jgi:uncharacterized protein YPO0396
MGAIDRNRFDLVPIGVTKSGQMVPVADEPSRWALTSGELPVVEFEGRKVIWPDLGDRELRFVDEHGSVQSLGEIDYNPGRFILLESQASPDAEIRDFQQELRACTEGAVTGSDDAQYSEAKFLQVKAIIDRFRGREGLSEQDRRWTAKVTDVRNWFLFAASERWREDNTEHEHYSDSGGKSGGQKEKLAYTILAASLAYQFGLEWGAVRSRSFRFVVIDEAFGRGSDESAQYGLKLFRQLNLQLLIVTPLQKIHIIEPYVASVGFVHNEGGRASKLRNLSIEEYRAQKALTPAPAIALAPSAPSAPQAQEPAQ